jgi:hypothetical protein
MTSSQPAGWQNPRILLILLLVFLCGASAGMLAMALGFHDWMHHRMARPVPAWKEGGREVSLQRFRQELNLTPQQTEQLETILDDFFTYYHTLQAQLDDVRASGRQKILRILDDSQKKKFEKLMTELQDNQQLR